jgi:hypothetical protein
MRSKQGTRTRRVMTNIRARGPVWVAGCALLLGGCAVEPEGPSHTSHDGLQDQLDALASQVEALQGELSNMDALAGQVEALQGELSKLAEELDALKAEEPSGLEWEVFTHTCGLDVRGPVSLGRSAEGIAVTHTFVRQAKEPEDSWRSAGLAIDIDAGDLTIYCSDGESGDEYVYLIALGWVR